MLLLLERPISYNKKSFICVPCGYSSCRKSNFKKHCSTITHKEQLNPVAVIEGFHKCKNCDMTYKSYQGLWGHNNSRCGRSPRN